MNFSNLIYNNDIEGVKRLIEGGCSPNEYLEAGETPLCLAVSFENKEIIEILLNAGADVNAVDKFGFTPLVGAVLAGNISVINLFMDFGIDISLEELIKLYKNID